MALEQVVLYFRVMDFILIAVKVARAQVTDLRDFPVRRSRPRRGFVLLPIGATQALAHPPAQQATFGAEWFDRPALVLCLLEFDHEVAGVIIRAARFTSCFDSITAMEQHFLPSNSLNRFQLSPPCLEDKTQDESPTHSRILDGDELTQLRRWRLRGSESAFPVQAF